ncbi:MAG: DUF6165 family protein [Myxococcota bacterium]
MRIDVPDGEVVDRITILELKVRFLGPEKRVHAERELTGLQAAWHDQLGVPLDTLAALPRLREVNAALWSVEDELRELERRAAFDDRFVALARSVYVLNDERARLKAAISEATGSRLREQKSYT